MFYKNLNSYLKLMKWRKIDLANATGICAESISRWNNDRFRPSRKSLIKIRDALNAEFRRQRKPISVTIDMLLAEDE